MKEKVRIGYIGLGRRGYSMLEIVFCRQKDVELVAICDVDTAKLSQTVEMMEKLGCPAPKTYTDYREMFENEQLDAAIIMTGWNQRLNIAMEAMEKGLYTGIEVGCAYDINQCYDLVKTYERTGSPIMMLENCCYGRQEMAALAMAKKKMFGTIVQCSGGYHHDLRRDELLKKNEDGTYDVNHYRMAEYVNRNCEQYPTHEFGPISKILGLNRGNRALRLRSIGSAARGLQEFTRERLPEDHPFYNTHVSQSDLVTTIIDCAGGEQIILTLDTTLPRVYYSRALKVRGTKGAVECVNGEHSTWRIFGTRPTYDNQEEWLEEHDHPLHKEYRKNAQWDWHGGIDWLMVRSFIESVKRGIEPPIDVYDTALWLAIAPLSEMSLAQDGAPVPVPDFTSGKWFCREEPLAWKYSLDVVCEEPETPIVL